MKNNRLILLVIVLLALFVGLSWGANRQMSGVRQPDFTTFSNNEYGVSLLFDTLRHMHYPVGILFRPVEETAGLNDAVFIIQPNNPRPDAQMADDILSWVRQGGRLIYLDNNQPSIIDRVLRDEYYTSFGTLRWYRFGMGQVITGRADTIFNISLLEGSIYGEGIYYILANWEPDRIYFAEFYHGFHSAGGFFGQLPLWLRLIVFQTVILAIALVWHLGKRFGKPIPLYEEIEREENEQVLVLARLYKQADRR